MIPKWTISIVSHGHKKNVTQLIRQLANTVDVDQASIVLTSNIGESFKEVESYWAGRIETRYNTKPKSFAANHNAALLGASTHYVAALDPDLVVMADPFAALELILSRSGDYAFASPAVSGGCGGEADHMRSVPTPMRLLRRTFGEEDSVRPDWLAGLFLATTSKCFDALEGFDTKFRLYCEDVDICLRAQLLGGKVLVCEEVTVVHDARRQSRRQISHFIWHVSSLLKLWFSRAYRDFNKLR